jgi:hypothetical protein
MTKRNRTLWLMAMYLVFVLFTFWLLIGGVLYWVDKIFK